MPATEQGSFGRRYRDVQRRRKGVKDQSVTKFFLVGEVGRRMPLGKFCEWTSGWGRGRGGVLHCQVGKIEGDPGREQSLVWLLSKNGL